MLPVPDLGHANIGRGSVGVEGCRILEPGKRLPPSELALGTLSYRHIGRRRWLLDGKPSQRTNDDEQTKRMTDSSAVYHPVHPHEIWLAAMRTVAPASCQIAR